MLASADIFYTTESANAEHHHPAVKAPTPVSTIVDRDYCASSYLAFRYVVQEGMAWSKRFAPTIPSAGAHPQIGVRDAESIVRVLWDVVARERRTKKVGLLLSGGMDSAILAALLPEGTPTYTIRFVSENGIDESKHAALYARSYGLHHRVIDVTWDDFERSMDTLMARKQSPLHAVEVGLHKASMVAAADGVESLIVGNGADSTFGGLDKLLSRDWTFDEFVDRYTFVDPEAVLVNAKSMVNVFGQYKYNSGIDVVRFLKVVHGNGIVQAFNNAIRSGGCELVEPYECMYLDAPLDYNRIRNGESKYLIREVFSQLYPHIPIPEKIPFARPMDEWLRGWEGPKRPEFRPDIPIGLYTGDQKFILYSLERFFAMLEKQNRIFFL